jgi:uncharacterized protein (DUF58 family)
VPERAVSGMTRRGRLALLLAAGVYLAAWTFGATVLYPVAVGLALAVGLAVAWVRLSPLPERVRRRAGPGELTEGDDLQVQVDVELGPGVRPPGVLLVERIGRLGVRQTALEVAGRHAWGRYRLSAIARGRYAFSESTVVVEDPFGLARAEQPLGESGALVVYPRLVELEHLFSETGAASLGGALRGLLVRRPAGVELHSVRDYQEGESLRAVHWPSTAKRGRLMVKDLEDAPRDELAVVLDARAGAVAGDPPQSSFEAQVRAAGSILKLYARRGRRATLLVNSTPRRVQRVRSYDGDWRLALELLASVEPTGRASLGAMLDDDALVTGRTSDLVLVTAVVDRALVDTLLRQVPGRLLTVVYVDAATFAPGTRPANRREPLLLRLQAAGVAVAVVRRGDDLAAVLGAAAPELAHG